MNAYHAIFGYFFVRQGWTKEQFDNMIAEEQKNHLLDLVEGHKFFSKAWKEKLKKDLGDIPGLDI
ncbi:MAG: hypothetical protein JST87_01415 [Bacteroidetes bacterium]|nr:hypothetical protein [Bacteroidota bacterium]